MKNKKIFIIILLLIYVTAITYYFFNKENKIKNYKEYTPKIENILIETPTPNEKYKIINRSIIVPENILNKKKVVLITIDDGPSSHTKEIVEILKNHNTPAIFFINGINNKKNQGVIEYIHQEGFHVGNHTWSHINLKKQFDIKNIEDEIVKNTELIKRTTGVSPKFFRAPYGESNSKIREIIKNSGMILMDWSGTAMDWDRSTKDVDIFIGNVMNNIHSGSIILIHEHKWSVANLNALLDTIESKGYTYVDPKDIIE